MPERRFIAYSRRFENGVQFRCRLCAVLGEAVRVLDRSAPYVMRQTRIIYTGRPINHQR